MEQARVMDRDHRLVGEGFEQPNFLFSSTALQIFVAPHQRLGKLFCRPFFILPGHSCAPPAQRKHAPTL
jgi:hypothetical protein